MAGTARGCRPPPGAFYPGASADPGPPPYRHTLKTWAALAPLRSSTRSRGLLPARWRSGRGWLGPEHPTCRSRAQQLGSPPFLIRHGTVLDGRCRCCWRPSSSTGCVRRPSTGRWLRRSTPGAGPAPASGDWGGGRDVTSSACASWRRTLVEGSPARRAVSEPRGAPSRRPRRTRRPRRLHERAGVPAGACAWGAATPTWRRACNLARHHRLPGQAGFWLRATGEPPRKSRAAWRRAPDYRPDAGGARALLEADRAARSLCVGHGGSVALTGGAGAWCAAVPMPPTTSSLTGLRPSPRPPAPEIAPSLTAWTSFVPRLASPYPRKNPPAGQGQLWTSTGHLAPRSKPRAHGIFHL